jgi:hypothetical protein
MQGAFSHYVQVDSERVIGLRRHGWYCRQAIPIQSYACNLIRLQFEPDLVPGDTVINKSVAAKHHAECGNRHHRDSPARPKADILKTRQDRWYPNQDNGQPDIRVSFTDSPQFVQSEREPLDLLRQGILELRHVELFPLQVVCQVMWKTGPG